MGRTKWVNGSGRGIRNDNGGDMIIIHCGCYVYMCEADILKRVVTPENKTENYKLSQDFWTQGKKFSRNKTTSFRE